MPHSAPIRPSIALAAFAEKFVDGRRVLVFGNALSPFWEQLIERGARLVHVCDSDAARVAEAAARNTSQHVSFAPLGGAGLAVRDGAFDVGFVENLASYVDPAGMLHRLKRALGPRGVALVAAPNPDVEDSLIASGAENSRPLDYYSLYDFVHREFPVVRMAGQMPFVGYSVAELAPAEEPIPSIDAGFVPGGTEEPEWFVAVASHVEVEFESFLVVQLAHEKLTKSGAERLLREQLRSARSAERSAVERLSRIEADQRKLTEAAERHQKDVDLARQIRLMQEELERKESWILQLEARAATADARADEADQELEELRSRVGVTAEDSKRPAVEDWQKAIERLETEKCELVSKLDIAENACLEAGQRAALDKGNLANQLQTLEEQRQLLDRKLEEQQAESIAAIASANAQRTQAERECEQLRTRIDESSRAQGVEDPIHQAEVHHLEAQLRERGERIRRLELDLKRTEEVGARLVRELERTKRERRSAREALEGPIAEPTEVGRHDQLEVTAGAAGAQPEPMTVVDLTHAAAPTGGTVADLAVSTVATDSWTQGPTASAPASTVLSAAQASAWPTPELQLLQEKLDRLAALAAKQQADLSAYDWRLQQLLDENATLSQRAEKLDEISEALAHAEERLQENAVLFAQVSGHREG